MEGIKLDLKEAKAAAMRRQFSTEQSSDEAEFQKPLEAHTLDTNLIKFREILMESTPVTSSSLLCMDALWALPKQY